MYSIQHYVIKFVVALNTISLNLTYQLDILYQHGSILNYFSWSVFIHPCKSIKFLLRMAYDNFKSTDLIVQYCLICVIPLFVFFLHLHLGIGVISLYFPLYNISMQYKHEEYRYMISLCVCFIYKVPCYWSNGCHVTLKLKLH